MEDEEVHHIKEEEELISIKKEEEKERPHIKQEEDEDISKFPLTGVSLKSEDGQREESGGAEPQSSSLSQHMRTERDGDHNGGSHPGGLLVALSDHDDMTTDSPDTEDDDDGQREEIVICFPCGCYHRSGVDDCRFSSFPLKKQILWARLCRRSDRQSTQPNGRLCCFHFKDGLMENDPVYFVHNHRKWMDSPDPGKRSQEQSETFVHEMATNSQQLGDEPVQIADDDPHEDHTYAAKACSSRCIRLMTKLKEEVKLLQKNVEDLLLECEKRKRMSISDIKDQKEKCRKCCDRRVKICAKTSVKYKEEFLGPKKAEETQYHLLDAVFNLQPRIVLRRADVSEYLNPGWHQSVPSHIKEEGEEVQCIKEEKEEILHVKEEEQGESIQVPSSGVHLKSEDGQSKQRQGTEHPTRNTSSDGDHCEGSQTDSHDDDEQSEGDRTCHAANKCWKCPRCRKTLACMRNFKQHVKIHTGEKAFACSVCDKRFTQKGQLKIHTRTHTGEKPFFCLICGQRFTRKGDLKRHTRTHTGEKPFSCPVCDKRFTENGDLKRHTRTHTGEKPFSCPVCNKRFTEKGKLKIHTRTHTGEKPFSCLVCGQRFTRKGDLKRHTRIHTGEKPFSCSVCDKRFTETGQLKIHTRTHTGEKPFSCLVCGQRFTQKGDLKRHTRTHTGEKPFSCGVCDKRFTENGKLKIHTRTHTSKKLLPTPLGQTFSSKYNNPSFFAVNGDQNPP
ncbi:zinc finger protein 180-like isoform X2 [Syngnathoides biaculeatus]|nr:zinc finger protein 180-like isoform X2 [Syngnathoides biaculeatus]XP_061663143.1 zinc finger protein 180-like isoform X2 [Syngnathoides biaculeatus]XP_061663144.1 zinc finger protein 180-like isoform X2 [Syngnathoides biaculeatus]